MFWKRFPRRGRKATKKADPRQPGDASTIADSLYSKGYAQLDQGNFPAAQVLFTQAIEALESEPDRHSALRASCWYRLGVARGDHQDRAGAVEAFGRAVAIFEEQHLQAESLYPRALTNWGIAQFAAMQSGASETLTRAVRLLAPPKQNDPALYVRALAALGGAQLDRGALTDARRVLTEAVDLLRRLDAATPLSWTCDLAEALRNLADAERRLKNSHAAMEHAQAALAVLQPWMQQLDRMSPAAAARIQHYFRGCTTMLAALLAEGHLVGAAEDLLSQVMVDTSPEERASSSPNDLVLDARSHLLRADMKRHRGNLDGARRDYEHALHVWERLSEAAPGMFDAARAQTLMSLGKLDAFPIVHISRVMSGVPAFDIGRGIERLREGAALFARAAGERQHQYLAERLDCWQSLGEALQKHQGDGAALQEQRDVRDVYREACACAEQLRDVVETERQRRTVQLKAATAYDGLYAAAIRCHQFEHDQASLTEALEAAEAARARNLDDLIGQTERHSRHAPLDLTQRYYAHRRLLLDAQRRFDEQWPVPHFRVIVPMEPQAREQQDRLDALDRELRELRARIREADPDFDPDQAVAPVKWDDIRALVRDEPATAAVHFTLRESEGWAIVLTRQGLEAVPLPGLTAVTASDLLREWTDAYKEVRALGEAAKDWEAALGHWEVRLAAILDRITALAIHPLESALPQDCRRLLLCPHRALHHFPLHACLRRDGRPLADCYESIAYAPSLSILIRCGRRSPYRATQTLVADNPSGDLPFAALEGACVSAMDPSAIHLTAREATLDNVLTVLEHSDGFHYAGHATFDQASPLESTLRLATAPSLTLRDMFARVRLASEGLAVLSSCDSGVVEPGPLDEFVGFPAGFLYAGAGCVVASQWMVDDLGAVLFMHRFYRLFNDGVSAGAALRASQRWMRDEIATGAQAVEQLALLPRDSLPPAIWTRCLAAAEHIARAYPDRPPFASPAHWAAFRLIGNAATQRARGAIAPVPAGARL